MTILLFGFWLAMAIAAQDGAKEAAATRVAHGDRSLLYLTHEDTGRRMQGDWEPPDGLLIVYTPAWSQQLAELVAVTAEQTRVYLLVPHGDPPEEAFAWLQEHDIREAGVHVVQSPVDTPWIRDYGPIPVREPDGRSLWLDTIYDPHRPGDDLLPRELGEQLGVSVEPLPLALDGGAVISNGAGLCAATRESLEKAGLDAYDAVQIDTLQRSLGCPTLAVVPALPREKTTHVDISAQFLAPDVVAVAWADAGAFQEEAELLDETAEALSAAAALRREPLRVVRVFMPITADGIHYTYLNGVRLPHDLVVPSYESVDTSEELQAHGDLRRALGLAGLIPVPADPLIELAGAWHCITVGFSNTVRTWPAATAEPRLARRPQEPAATVTR